MVKQLFCASFSGKILFKSADTKDIIMSIKKRDIPLSGDSSEKTSETESENGGDLGEPRVIHLFTSQFLTKNSSFLISIPQI